MGDDLIEKLEKMKRLVEEGYEGGILTFVRPKDNIKTDKKLKNWALQNSLKGLGKEDNPYLIEETNDLPEMFYVSRVKSYVKIRNRKFNVLNLFYCKNFHLENCVFRKLTLINCKNFKINSCEIQILNLLRAKNNNFTDSTIEKIFNDFSSANIFRSCTFSSNAKSKIYKTASKRKPNVIE